MGDVNEQLQWLIQYEEGGREYEYTMDTSRMRKLLTERAAWRELPYKIMVKVDNEWKSVRVE